jgi:flagellar biosynthesis chaperone FliJ
MPTLTVTPVGRPARPSRSSRGLVSLFVAVVVIAVGFAQRQAMYDWYRLRGYQASVSVAALANDTTMTAKSRHFFYVNHPQVQDKTDFNRNCPDNGGEQTIILGCYIPLQRGIYVYDVDDPQLKGVQEVTAAHEMLHSAYDRLSAKDRANVDSLLQNYYDHDLHDKRLLATMESYKKTEPNDLLNEMHSIFGTEIATLPPALEKYYKQYFTDRQAVVGFAAQYQQAFTSRQDQITSYDQQLQTLKKEIDDGQAALTAQSQSLDAQRETLNNLRNSGDIGGYNAQVNNFNAQINRYNGLVAQTKAKITEYNNLVAKRNAVALETQNLSQELNSHIQDKTTKQ